MVITSALVALLTTMLAQAAPVPAPAVAPAPAGLPTPVVTPPPGPPQIAFPGQYAAAPTTWKYPVWSKGCVRYVDPAERIACTEFIHADWPRLARFAAANAELAPAKPRERRVVFFGDSITDNWSKSGYGGFFPGKPYINRGIGGQTTAHMLVRFRADVIALKPRAVVILAGTNDVAGNAGVVTPEAIQNNITSMAELARGSGIKVVLAASLPVSDDKKDTKGQPVVRTTDRPPETVRALNTWIAAYAKKHRHIFLDYHTALADSRGMLKPELNDDGLHPNAAGYAVMTALAENALTAAIGSR